MKKSTVRNYVLAAVSLLLLLIFGGGLFLMQDGEQEALPLEMVLEEKLTAYETDFRDSLGSMDTDADVASYLIQWAKNRQIPVIKDSYGNVIYTINASGDAKEAPPAVLLTNFAASDLESCAESLAVALTAAKNAQNNCFFKVIFLAESGIQNLNLRHIPENAAVFCLDSAASGSISTVTGGYKQIEISSKLPAAGPVYNKAYRITMENCPSASIAGAYEAALNPIKILGTVLADFKSTSLLFELAEFEGGTDACLSPSDASVTIVINDSDSARFEKKMNSFINKTVDKYGETYPQMRYTYEETDLPSSVLEKDCTDNLVSLMYTLFNGVYTRNEEGTITALTNIGRLSTENGQLHIDFAVMCCDDDMLQEIADTCRTICGLCDVNFRIKESVPVYNGSTMPQTDALLTSFESAYHTFTGDSSMEKEDTAVLTSCSFIHEEREELPMIFCGITSKNKHKIAGSIVTWLDQGM